MYHSVSQNVLFWLMVVLKNGLLAKGFYYFSQWSYLWFWWCL